MAKPVRAAIVEGKDDVAATRALLVSMGLVIVRGLPRTSSNTIRLESSELAVEIVSAPPGKDTLVERTLHALQGGAETRPDRVVVCFDPDEDPPAKHFKFFVDVFNRSRKAGPLKLAERGEYEVRIGKRDARVIPGPWSSSGQPAYAGLDGTRCLERILIAGIVQATSRQDLKDWAFASTTSLLTLASDHGYKRALRIWSAVHRPDAADSFVDALLQDHATRDHVLEALKRTEAAKALERLLAP